MTARSRRITVLVIAAALIALGGLLFLIGRAVVGPWLAERSGVRDIPFVSEFDLLFPGSFHFISYYTGDYGPPTWNSKAGLHGRYVLTCQCRISFNRTRTRITEFKEPRFFLTEVVSVDVHPEGGAGIQYGRSWSFDLERWRCIVASGGDLSECGFDVDTDAPIEGFNRAWKGA